MAKQMDYYVHHLQWLAPLFLTPVFALEVLLCVAFGSRLARRLFLVYVAVSLGVFAAVFSDLGATQKVMLSTTGGYQLSEWPMPKASVPGVAVVKVKAFGLNPADYKVINNLASVPFLRWVVNQSPSYDFAGVVTEVGPSMCENLKVGDAVFGVTLGVHREYSLAFCPILGKLPSKVSFIQGAAGPTVSYTAIIGLEPILKPGSKILVIGSAGGTGQAAVIYAKIKKAGEIVCIASGKNLELSMKKGCTKFYDYTSPDFEKAIQREYTGKFDVIYDTVSEPFPIYGPYVSKMVPCLNAAGKYITLTPNVEIALLGNRHRHVTYTALPSRAQIDYVGAHAELFEDLSIAYQTEALNITNIYHAYELLKSHRTAGKIVLTVGDQKRS